MSDWFVCDWYHAFCDRSTFSMMNNEVANHPELSEHEELKESTSKCYSHSFLGNMLH